MLTLETVVPFLQRRGLIDERPIVAEQVVVHDVSRRNLAFTVSGGSGARFFLKQPHAGRRVQFVAAEARIYRWLDGVAGASDLRPFLPRLRWFDEGECALVLDLIDDSSSLADLQWRRRRLPAAVGTTIGRAVATLHRVTGAALRASAADGAPIEPSARYLQLHRPNLETFLHSSAGTVQLVRVMQASEELSRCLDDLERGWRVDSVIHADLRLDNFRIGDVQPDGSRRLTIVDWETAGTGDSCWDVGTFFAGCLYFWLLSAPITRDSPPDTFVALARLSLPMMQPVMRRFWRSYATGLGIAGATRAECLVRSVRYAGACLVRHAFEEVQHATRMTATVIYLLQLGVNMMQQPADAAVRLLGLPAPDAVEP